MKKHAYTFSVLAVFSVLFWFLPSYFDSSETLQTAGLKTRDLFFKIRSLSTRPPAAIQNILIVSIDEQSCQKLDARWPWSRKIFASMIDELAARGARVVGLNLSFTGSEAGDESSSEALARAMSAHGNVVIGATFDRDSRLTSPSAAIASAASRYGYLEKIVDPDFAIRRSYFIRFYSDRSGFENSFPLQLLLAYKDSSGQGRANLDGSSSRVMIGRTAGVFVNADGSYTVNYLADQRDFAEIPAWKAVQGKLRDEDVRGKAVLVGLTSSLFSDMHPTPVGMMPGIAIHANEFLSVLSGRPLRFVPDPLAFFLSWLVGICVLALFLFRRFWLALVGFFMALLGLFLGAQAGFSKDVVVEPFVLFSGPVLAALIGLVSNSLKLLWENKGLETRVIHDKMTGLYKYEYLRECLEEEWKRCHRANLPLAVVMTDLDRFKIINDTLGHETGNEMIKRAAEVIRQSARRYDIVSRYGGDEFVILLWHATAAEANAYRDRLRILYQEMTSKLENPMLRESSISIGIASFDPSVDRKHPSDPQKLIEEADKDLFLDKESRRKER